jgi:hypothetical protein
LLAASMAFVTGLELLHARHQRVEVDERIRR